MPENFKFERSKDPSKNILHPNALKALGNQVNSEQGALGDIVQQKVITELENMSERKKKPTRKTLRRAFGLLGAIDPLEPEEN